ncbi:MAG: hypothetical protein HN736_06520 [Anaerolineae bacterium]|nr:hypothetical protein [Anaerolineae bacterium]MBT4310474.1 hypothetical protein [Anaerolineae bacterium]MBT4459226.1 hypothetical protein [Anaerolineae bacterium]MBT6060615.1 hypothetical protein [Anaerolineae bacterium]MBT6322466.1 hypothetical protein [Anaerolineae bacterium]
MLSINEKASQDVDNLGRLFDSREKAITPAPIYAHHTFANGLLSTPKRIP